jgi:hypothetical protein
VVAGAWGSGDDDVAAGAGAGADDDVAAGAGTDDDVAAGAGTDDDVAAGAGAGTDDDVAAGAGAGDDDDVAAGAGAGADDDVAAGAGADDDVAGAGDDDPLVAEAVADDDALDGDAVLVGSAVLVSLPPVSGGRGTGSSFSPPVTPRLSAFFSGIAQTGARSASVPLPGSNLKRGISSRRSSWDTGISVQLRGLA